MFVLSPFTGGTILASSNSSSIAFTTPNATTLAFSPVKDARDDAVTTPEDSPITIPVLANDGYTGTNYSVTSNSTPVNGSAVINPDGTITYTPDKDFNGIDIFTYTVTSINPDGTVSTETATVTVTVIPVKDAKNDVVTTPEDTPIRILVLANDGYVGTNHAVTGCSTPSNGSAVMNLDGTILYTPNKNFNGTDTFTYTVTVTNLDGTVTTETATVTVTVTPVNDFPVAHDVSISVAENKPYSDSVVATDVDGDILTYSKDVLPKNGAVVINSKGAYVYTPNLNYIGPDLFTINVDDGNGGFVIIAVNVVVAPVNQPPVVVDDSYTVLGNKTFVGNVLNNDSDPENDPLTLKDFTVNGMKQYSGSHVTIPDVGIIAMASDGSFTFTPERNYSGTLPAIIYTVSDGVLTATGNVKIKVLPLPEIYKSANNPVLNNDGTFSIIYKIKLVNGTNHTVDSIQVEDNLDDVFLNKGCSYHVTSVLGSGNLIAKGTYSGSNEIRTLTGVDSLRVNAVDSIMIEVNVDTHGQADSVIVLNQAIFTGRMYNGRVSVFSDDINITGLQDPTKTILPFVNLFIPDAFSPNGDGTNDKFTIKHPAQTTIQIEIINRWNNLVYKNDDYQNDWDGQGTDNFLGRNLPDGTYYCIYKVINKLNGEIMSKGVKYLTLHR